MKTSISAVILTLNEERNLPKAIRSVRMWVEDIVVVDMHSDDRTVEVAESFGARVFQHPRMGLQDPARQFAMEKATGEWIINLDADEIAPSSLSRRLVEVAEGNLADVCSIPRLNYFSGAALHHAGWNADEDRQVRFFRRGYLEFSPRIHARPQPVGHARVLQLHADTGQCLIHFNFLDAEHFLQKFNRYTTIEAEQVRGDGRKSSLSGFIVTPFREFFTRFILKRGFRDGWRGLYYSAMLAAYQMTVTAKLKELEDGCDAAGSLKRYDEIAEQYLSEHERGER